MELASRQPSAAKDFEVASRIVENVCTPLEQYISPLSGFPNKQ